MYEVVMKSIECDEFLSFILEDDTTDQILVHIIGKVDVPKNKCILEKVLPFLVEETSCEVKYGENLLPYLPKKVVEELKEDMLGHAED
jgi:adenylate kinase